MEIENRSYSDGTSKKLTNMCQIMKLINNIQILEIRHTKEVLKIRHTIAKMSDFSEFHCTSSTRNLLNRPTTGQEATASN